MSRLFAATLLVGALLSFLLQVMVGRLVLPVLGGGPGVWNTCLVFFQATLLLGYAYAHVLPSRTGRRLHAALHLALLVGVFLVLPVSLPPGGSAPESANPGPWLLGMLAVVAGLPFFAVSTTAPLLQAWFAETDHPRAADPYFLYGASNVGSLLALLAYPFVLEPAMGLEAQASLWTLGYAVFVALVVASAVALWRSPRRPRPEAVDPAVEPPAERIAARRRLRWAFLAFVPSSLLSSVTTFLTTDVAAIPLLWVVPLALYLLTYVLAFGRARGVRVGFFLRWLPLVVLVLVVALLSEATEPVLLLVALHVLGLFWIGLACHGRLAADRPRAADLTGFYLWIALGGVAGGATNALLAPVLFDRVAEYPLVLVLACLVPLVPSEVADRRPAAVRSRRLDVALPLGLGAATAALVLVLQARGIEPGPPSLAAMFGAPLAICYAFSGRPLRFALGIAALLLASGLYHGVHGRTEVRRRTFFGVHRVTVDAPRGFRQLVHGNTIHGRQRLGGTGPPEPLSYYHRTGPAGRVFEALRDVPRVRRVGLVGLGAGSLASYAKSGQRWTVFEIDPVVVDLARGAYGFTFLEHCPAEVRYVIGDARQSLARSDERFDLLVVDAFGSDSVPVHLLTREALGLYLRRLEPEGLLVFNVSNRYLNLRPVLADLAAAASPPLACFGQDDTRVSAADREAGKSPSRWVVMSRSRDGLLEGVLRAGRWEELRAVAGARPWTDDHCDLVRALE